MFNSVLVANRGEIARRVIRTCRRLGIRTVAVYSEVDAQSLHVLEADEAVRVGPAPAAQSYLNAEGILAAASGSEVQAVHPGYGFLSENAAFAQEVIDAGLAWIGPAPEVIERMSDKVVARELMAAAGVPIASGAATALFDVDTALEAAAELGYPLMVKASAGGGGIGMGVARNQDQLRQAFGSAQDRAERFFGSSAILLERYIHGARHIEVQILGLGDGSAIALGERDCSIQRRHQKVLEETPAVGLATVLRQRLISAALRAAESVGYTNAGTVEFLVDQDSEEFFFLEMNTRLQVEHPITEMVHGVDLVEQQLRIASGEQVTIDASRRPTGHAIELRVYAEDPVRFLPSPGTITRWDEPIGPGIRVDGGYRCDDVVTPHYDPLLAKVCVLGKDRTEALRRARGAVDAFNIAGVKVNIDFLRRLLASTDFASGSYDTGLVNRLLD